MSNLIFDRIKNQYPPSKIVEPTPAPREESLPQETNTPIHPQELKRLFMSEGEEKQVVIEPPSKDRIFKGIEDFVLWYIPLQDKFGDGQRVALQTLVKVNNEIHIGCACKKTKRQKVASEYFITFWQKNKDTDLIPKIKEVGGFNSISFFENGEVFLTSTPPATPENS